MPYLFVAAAAFLATYLCVPIAKRLAQRWGAIDYPSKRRINTTPIPRLGGVAIPNAPQVVAHSDGDVLLHALTDALLGCLAEGDIDVFLGNWMPTMEADIAPYRKVAENLRRKGMTWRDFTPDEMRRMAAAIAAIDCS